MLSLFQSTNGAAVTVAKVGLRIGWRESWVVAALAAYALARLSPPLESLSPQGQAVLGAMAAGATLWISEATPIGVTAIVVTVLLALSPGAKLADAVGGFASEVVFFLIGAVAIGTAVEVSGLAARAARFLGAPLCADDREPARLRRSGAVGDHAQCHSDPGL
jgi:sodium-dependent dicarboxylate transporter 2/3/5